MDHGRLFSRGEATEAACERFTGLPLAQAAAAIGLEDLRRLGPASRVDFGAVAGQPVATALGAGDARILLKGVSGAVYDRRLPDVCCSAPRRQAGRMQRLPASTPPKASPRAP